MRDAHVEMAGRFVEQQDRRLLREPERDPDALALAGAQRREEPLGETLDAHGFERARDRMLVFVAALPLPPAMVRKAPDRDDVANVQRFEQDFVAGDERDAPCSFERAEAFARAVRR